MQNVSWALLGVILIAIAAAFIIPKRRLKHAVDAPFPAQWRTIIRQNVPLYRKLPTDLQQQLQRLVKQFVHEKDFSGCNGLTMTEEIKVTIAASACLLLLNRKTDVFGGLRYILVYPDAFVAQRERVDGAGLHSSYPEHLLGESWDSGKVILSWRDVLQGNQDPHDGHNVVLHEFAHQLDAEAGPMDGAPVLSTTADYQQWAKVLNSEYEHLRHSAFQGDHTLIDTYGATNPAEFFAVVTEVFFERPHDMQQRHPDLFKQLQHYYQVDPTQWN